VVQIIEVTGFGVRSAVLRLRRQGSPMQYVVYPMIHIGTSDFYEEVGTRLRHAQLVVVEGVKDGARPSARALVATRRPGDRLQLAFRLDMLTEVLHRATVDGDSEAVEVAAEAVEVWRAVAATYPVRRRELAHALSWLAALQRRDRVEDLGLACAEEAEAIARSIAAEHPERGRQVLATVLPRLARVLDAVGEPERARAITDEMAQR
jgi:hypothetical protein